MQYINVSSDVLQLHWPTAYIYQCMNSTRCCIHCAEMLHHVEIIALQSYCKTGWLHTLTANNPCLLTPQMIDKFGSVY